MTSEEEDHSKGPVVHQESKTFDGEYQLITVFDNPDRKIVTFEAYSLETSEGLVLRYSYTEFDQFFRFNAELMNPNNREGRYHWIIKRLVFASDGSTGRKLALGGKPTEETPEVPVYTQVKIPTGRMNYNERQRLRDEMERLDMRRNENIEKKRIARERKFIAELEEQKVLVEMRQKQRMEKIAQEKSERYTMIAEAHQGDLDRKMELRMLDQERLGMVAQREAARLEREEEEVKATILKHRAEREAKQKQMDAAQEHKRQVAEQIVKNDESAHELVEKLAAKREEQWLVREERIGKKEDTYLDWLQHKSEEEIRKSEITEEKRLNAIRVAAQGRESLFREQFQVSAERAAYAQATKPKQPGEVSPTRISQKAMKKKAPKDHSKTAIDPVHEQMMEHIAQKNLNTALEKQRTERQLAAEKNRNQQEAEKAEEWRERKKEEKEMKAEAARQRKSIKEEKEAQLRADTDRMKQERARLDGLREMRIRDKANARAKSTTA